MTKYSGTVVNDKVAVHSSPSKGGGNKIGNPLKTGTAITGIERNAGFMHITTPLDGWVLETDIEFTDSDSVQTTSTINQPTTNLTTDNTPATAGNPNHLGVFRLKRWDELNPADTFSVKERGGGDQFGFYTPYIMDASGKWCGSRASNDNYSLLTEADMLAIRDMQEDDENTIEQKMQYLTSWGDGWGGPMRVPGGGDWKNAERVKMIGAVYAGQKVEVLEHKTIYSDFLGKKENLQMSRIRTFSRADFGKSFATHPHLIQKMTGVNVHNQYRDKVKGTVYLPVALGPEFDFTGSFQPAQWWLMDRWIAFDEPAS
jgi:hypothetical protein